MLACKPLQAVRQTLGDSPQVLTEVLQDGVNLAVWQRQLPVHIDDFARLLLSLNMPLGEALTLELQDDGEVPVLHEVAAGYRDLQGYEGFIADVSWLVGAFACLVGAKRVGLRIQALERAMCPRFHVDHVPLRLITTYAGPASEWLADGVLNRQEIEPRHIRQLKAGDVAVFKGEKWLGNEGAGIVHRSPALGAGERRLILTLDWMA